MSTRRLIVLVAAHLEEVPMEVAVVADTVEDTVEDKEASFSQWTFFENFTNSIWCSE